ncbi:MAG: adenylate/guanylate cyclase domain-containing protein [Deltaproteobacteria bacterium]|nr:adenylate/guanylate cyclase domain-containing protein [Deltaproteobacteria bacterium]
MAIDLDLESLTLTEIIRLQNQLSQVLSKRFERRVAVAFSDIVGSTTYFARWGDEAGRKLQQLHTDLLQQVIKTYDGRIVDTAGDGAFTSFPKVDDAVEGLIDFLKTLSRENAARTREHQLNVRIGIHFGPVLTDGTMVSGDSVNLASRVTSTAEPGEIRLTREAFREISHPTRRISCKSQPPATLKGIPRPVELMIMDWRDRSVFPASFRIEETGEELALPDQDIVTFGRLIEHDGQAANDIVLSLPDKMQAKQISRWHFELRRRTEGLVLRSVSDALTEVDGKSIPKGEEARVRPGTTVRVARVMTLKFQGAEGASDNVEGTLLTP